MDVTVQGDTSGMSREELEQLVWQLVGESATAYSRGFHAGQAALGGPPTPEEHDESPDDPAPSQPADGDR